MAKLGISDYVRFEAIDDESGILGCTRSHAAVMKQMVESELSCLLVCEDDARFEVTRDQLDALVEAFLNDRTAEVACLAYWHRSAERHNLLYLRTRRSFTTACYLVKGSIAPDLMVAWDNGARELAAGGDRELHGLDHAWRPLQEIRVFLVAVIRAVHQQPGYSDIWQQDVRPGY
jgi:hypothetical protein